MDKHEQLLARLASREKSADNQETWAKVESKAPQHTARTQPNDDKLNGLLNRINTLANGEQPPPAPAQPAPTPRPAPAHQPAARPPAATNRPPAPAANAARPAPGRPPEPGPCDEWFPPEPTTLKEADISESSLEGLILKFLLHQGDSSGRGVSDQVKLPFMTVEPVLRQMKFDQLLVYRGSAAMNDYVYQLTDIGRERAKAQTEHCTYFGSAPVSLKDYVASVKHQTIEGQHPTRTDLKRAFEDLLINPRMLDRLGPAINSGRGMFLFGFPGNGKTSIAERVTKAFGQFIWIPRAIGVDGEVMRLFDPMNHEVAPLDEGDGLLQNSRIDRRWIRIRRPTIVVGGELTMDNLEVTMNSSTGISEAPVQLKSNCGTLVIDDFGRQRMSVDELLNRWIVPLEKRYDFLNLANGKKIQVPFDQLIVFSTNLEPKDLVDDAFLRRIPYKIEVMDPSEEDFRKLFEIMCPIMKFDYRQGPIDHLVETHYKAVNRPFRCCQPRDLLLQVRNYCLYQDYPVELKNEYFDFAAENYFAVM